MTKILEQMIKELKENENLCYDDVVEEYLNNISFEGLIDLVRELKDEEDFQDELKDLVFPYFLGKLEDKFEEEV